MGGTACEVETRVTIDLMCALINTQELVFNDRATMRAGARAESEGR